MITLSFFKFVEDELGERYYFRLKDFGLTILLLNIAYILYSVGLYVMYNFSFISFMIGYLVNTILQIDIVLKYFKKLYSLNKNILTKLEAYMLTVLNDLKKLYCDNISTDDINSSNEVIVESTNISKEDDNIVDNNVVETSKDIIEEKDKKVIEEIETSNNEIIENIDIVKETIMETNDNEDIVKESIKENDKELELSE
jgi:hypothetical protein